MKKAFGHIFGPYLRWRHSRGFGVHSPFAYGIVDIAIRPGIYGWYGYEDIEESLAGTPIRSRIRLRHVARLLLRLLAVLRKRRLVYDPADNVAKAAAVGAGIHEFADIETASDFCDSDFIFCVNGGCSCPTLRDAVAAGAAVMAVNADEKAKKVISDTLRNGVLMTGTNILLAIPREEMARVDYTMKF